ncbi:MAG: adenine deaminase [Xanthomonadaceae bacterium]|nr:adenine deaminase [Xanthomonadaceae bacterium]
MQKLSTLIDAAMGRSPCDLIIKDVRFLDVFQCKWRVGDISIKDGYIVGVESGLKSKRVVSAKGKFLVPGFIDAHVHVESSLMAPGDFESVVLPHGTTTAICDPHEITNVIGVKGLEYFVSAAESLSLDLRVMLSSCVPASHPGLETNGAGVIESAALEQFKNHEKVLGLAEMMNMPGVIHNDPIVHEKLEHFQDRMIDGHAPLLQGRELSAYATAGISSCHESSSLKEASEKLSKGLSCWIREGSVAKDLEALAPLLTIETSTSIGFCTDDRNPLDIAREGHIDHLIRGAIKSGVKPEIAYRAASWSVAKHYGLRRVGAIAPGYRADLVMLGDAKKCSVLRVWKSGVDVKDLPFIGSKQKNFENTIRALETEDSDFIAPTGQVNTIGVRVGQILTDHLVMNSSDQGVAKLSVIERYGNGQKPANAYAYGFGSKFRGAIASSVGHDSHNLIVVGKSESDMNIATRALRESGGGFCVVDRGVVTSILPLPFGGLMSTETPKAIEKKLVHLRKASHAIGCEYDEPFLQLAFLSLPVIPSLKLTDKGLVDVNQFKIIGVRSS